MHVYDCWNGFPRARNVYIAITHELLMHQPSIGALFRSELIWPQAQILIQNQRNIPAKLSLKSYEMKSSGDLVNLVDALSSSKLVTNSSLSLRYVPVEGRFLLL